MITEKSIRIVLRNMLMNFGYNKPYFTITFPILIWELLSFDIIVSPPHI